MIFFYYFDYSYNFQIFIELDILFQIENSKVLINIFQISFKFHEISIKFLKDL